MRIAVYHNLHSGGAKRIAAEHIRRLSGYHDVTLFSLNTANHTFGVANSDLQVPTVIEQFQPWPWLRSPFGRLNTLIGMGNIARLDAIMHRVATTIDRQHFDVVLVHPCQFAQSPQVLRWLRTPALYYCHELPRMLYEPEIPRPYHAHQSVHTMIDRVDPLPRLCRAYYRAVDRRAACCASQITVNSHYTAANVWRTYGRHAEVCYQGVDFTKYAPTNHPRERFVLSIGALIPAKGFDFVIEAVATMPAADRHLIVISNYQDQEELTYLTDLANRRHIRLNCRVNISESELHELYARAGCVAYAPVREPFGLVALEAMAAAAPLVAVNEGGLTETIIPHVTGMIVPREAGAFGQAITNLLNNPAQAEQLGNAARRHVCTMWTWERHIAQLEQLLVDTAHQRTTQLAYAPD